VLDEREAPDPPSAHAPASGPTAGRRARCVWLGGLASHRQGLIKRLVKACGSVSEMLDCSPEALSAALRPHRAGGRRAAHVSRPSPTDTVADTIGSGPGNGDAVACEDAFRSILNLSPQKYLQWAEGRGPGHSVIAWCDPLYPPSLRNLADPPMCLFLRHHCCEAELVLRLQALCSRPAVAVVGTRGPSVYGEEMAALLGRDLTARGVLVISGLAAGIDALAQAAAVRAARGTRTPTTVAVLGCGADVVYPQANRELYLEIACSGLLLSEFAWLVPARPWRFPARNRVMAGLSRAVVVVEGGDRSGARLTADYALELGREVLAVPGEAGRRLTSAPHRLLRHGAALCESADDVLAAMTPFGPAGSHPASTLMDGPDAFQLALDNGSGVVTDVLQALLAGPMSADQVARRCAVPINLASAALSELEVDGLVRLVGGGVYRLRRG
jgi:DNA processing protein